MKMPAQNLQQAAHPLITQATDPVHPPSCSGWECPFLAVPNQWLETLALTHSTGTQDSPSFGSKTPHPPDHSFIRTRLQSEPS